MLGRPTLEHLTLAEGMPQGLNPHGNERAPGRIVSIMLNILGVE